MEDFDEFVERILEQNNRLPKTYIRDMENPFEMYSDVEFKMRFRFTKVTVRDEILPLVEVALQKPSNRGLPVLPILQLFVGLRYYATGTHITIRTPGGENGEVFRNRKRQFLVNVQVACRPRMEIMDKVARHQGSTHDNVVFERSSLRIKYENGEIPGKRLIVITIQKQKRMLTREHLFQHILLNYIFCKNMY